MANPLRTYENIGISISVTKEASIQPPLRKTFNLDEGPQSYKAVETIKIIKEKSQDSIRVPAA